MTGSGSPQRHENGESSAEEHDTTDALSKDNHRQAAEIATLVSLISSERAAHDKEIDLLRTAQALAVYGLEKTFAEELGRLRDAASLAAAPQAFLDLLEDLLKPTIFALSGSETRVDSFNLVRDLVDRSGLVDPDWYRKEYPDVRQHELEPIIHYIKYGAAEGRHPNSRMKRRQQFK